MAPPAILLAAATGNTGRCTTATLSTAISSPTTAFPDHRLLITTRNPSSPSAQALAALPHVELAQISYPDITPDWLISNNVIRAFIAPASDPVHFPEESSFLLALLRAGVRYCVRISTMSVNVRPDCLSWSPRDHWAIEALLSAPEYSALHWTSLQPNNFGVTFLYPAALWIQEYRRTGKQGTLGVILDEVTPVAIVDADDVGILAATLLLEEDTGKHNKARYVVNGPEDVNGRDIVRLVEERIGTKVESVKFRDMAFIMSMARGDGKNKSLWDSVTHVMETTWEGKAAKATESKEVLELAAPKTRLGEMLDKLLRQMGEA